MPDGDTNEVSVKVAVRIRPLTNRERLHKHQPCVQILPETNQIIIGKDKAFTFDYVLPPKISQKNLYDECVDSLVDSLFDGYNATVFAYGQTGSGKTFTINGNIARDEEVGIIPRAVKRMFDIMKDQQDKQFSVKVSFLEIYKEELKDLLDTSDKELHIREDELGSITIHNACEYSCSTLDDVMSCFNAGSTIRHTGSTNMNEQSSRSHSIFTVFVEQRWTSETNANNNNNNHNNNQAEDFYDTDICDQTNDVYYLGAKFHFVDLAGSERVGRTGNVGERFKESIHINTGLLVLGNVISALSSNDKKKNIHIPYRDSKITRILKDSLGGNAKTLMICCISPSSVNLDESINAVKYASRARYIKNKPIVNMDPQQKRFVEMQSEIKALREELHRQRTQLASAENNQNHQHVDENEVRQLENRLLSIQSECDHNKKLVKDACARFKEISKFNDLDESVKLIIMNWFESIETSKSRLEFDSEDYAKQRIMQLELKLQQALNDLKSDEEIFADKEKEINDLKEKIKDLESNLSAANRYLESAYSKEKEQQELMVQLQIQLDKMMQGKQQIENISRLSSINEKEVMNDRSNLQNKSSSTPSLNTQSKQQRAKTAPNAQMNQLKGESRKNRNVFSSPALFSLEKVMQGFRARSQLLAETLEENDNVLQKEFLVSDNDDDLNNRDDNNKHFVRRGTYSKKKTLAKKNDGDDELEALTKSTEFRQKALKESETKLKDAQKKMRDLSINIRMKEELIKELVASSKSAHRVNVQYQHRIDTLQKEANMARTELAEMQRALTQLNGKDSNEKSKIEMDYKKKLELAQQKIHELESRQKDTVKLLNSTTNPDKRINELELTLNKMKQQQETLQKKIKEDAEKKIKLEKDLEKEQQKIKDLQSRNDQQQKILKKKTEDLAVAQRRLRSASSSGILSDENTNSKQHWVEQEMEKIIQERKQLDFIKDELSKREELCKKRELLLQEKNELQIKKLRSSQNVRESLNIVNQKIETLDRQLKDSVPSSATSIKENLFQTQSNLIQQRKQLDERLNQGCILSTAEERRLIEVEEAIEALDIAIKFENDSIKDQETKLKKSQLLNNSTDLTSDGVLNKLTEIPHEEAKYLVKKFFHKIIDLKELERKKDLLNDELQIQLDEKNRIVEELKKSINLQSNDLDRRLTIQQQQYEKQISSLLEQLNECTNKILNYEKELSQYKEKIRKTTATKRIIDDHGDNNNNIVGDYLPVITKQSSQTNGFHLNNNNNNNEHSQQQLFSARTVSSVTSVLNSQRNIDYITSNNQSLNGNTAAAAVSGGGLINYCKDSLNDASINLDSSSKQVLKVSKKDLRQLSEAEIMKRSKKSTS